MNIYRIKNGIRRRIITRSSNSHPASYPFISGDTFRSLARHIYDDVEKCTASDIKNDDIVFIKTDFIKEFFTHIHPHIPARYKIVTHNSDKTIGKEELSYIDDKIIRWFGHNVLVEHPKLTPIPIGIENASYCLHGDLPMIQRAMRREPSAPKKNHVLFGFSVSTNPTERAPAIKILRAATVADEIKVRLSPSKYIEKLKTYKFVAAPSGNGPDTHWTWEALLFGVIPIVRRNPIIEHFQKIGLPVMIIDDWNDILKMSENDLDLFYTQTMKTCGLVKDNLMSYAYWQGIISSPEDRRDEAVVIVAIGRKFQESYRRLFQKSHEKLCADIHRPLILIKDCIQDTEKGLPWQKLLIFRTPILSNINRVMLIDADIYIKDTRENPLIIVPRDRWGLCDNNAFDLPTLASTTPILYKDCPTDGRPDFVLNTGFFVVDKRIHGKMMEYVFEHYTEQVCNEQGPFCYHLVNEFIGAVLPFKFNNIVGSYMEKFGYSMTSVVNMYKESNFLHFAGHANDKILRIYLAFERYPWMHRAASWPPLLAIFDHISHAIKAIKGIK